MGVFIRARACTAAERPADAAADAAEMLRPMPATRRRRELIENDSSPLKRGLIIKGKFAVKKKQKNIRFSKADVSNDYGFSLGLI